MFSLHHKTQCPLHLYIYPRVIITETKLVLYLCTCFRVLVWLLKEFPLMTDIKVKIVSPIQQVDGMIYLVVSSFSFKLFQSWVGITLSISSIVILVSINSQKMLLIDLPSLTPCLILLTFIQENHQKTLYKDVVTLDKYLNLYNKTKDTETHRIQNQA